MDISSNRPSLFVALTGLLVAVMVPATTLAQQSDDGDSSSSSASDDSANADLARRTSRLKIYGKGGFGGEASGEIQIDEFDDEDIDEVEMEDTYGFGGEYAYPINKYFLIGGRLEFNFVNESRLDDDNVDRTTLMNIDVVPRGRLPIEGTPLEFHLSVPIGLTFNFPNSDIEDDLEDRYGGFVDADLGTGLSWNVSFLAGLTYWFDDYIGLWVEQGWYHQQLVFPGDARFAGESTDFTYKSSFNQFAFQLGLNLRL